ncbi:protein phosphatase 2C domain-containing protein [Arthrobacter gyeryongensis]|uniref:Protein phosphatase 2C domain-containing protein n=2 Tax=Arthrobacter gyeryongensis TaxID=1650592 RepID=A0ABP9SEK4_9MICC
MSMNEKKAGSELLQLQWGIRSDTGLKRKRNEDAVFAVERLFVVADGMGGHEAGEVASSICVQILSRSASSGIVDAAGVSDALRQADAQIRAQTSGRAGTTVAGVALVDEAAAPYWLVFNIGDSRTYRLSRGKLQRVSVDHSEVQEMLDDGDISVEEALVHPRRHVVTRALGAGGNSEADYWMLPAEEGDRMLICSDGLSTEVGEEEILKLLSEMDDAQETADALIQAALNRGGRDNVSVIVIDAGSEPRGQTPASGFDALDADDSTVNLLAVMDRPGGEQ